MGFSESNIMFSPEGMQNIQHILHPFLCVLFLETVSLKGKRTFKEICVFCQVPLKSYFVGLSFSLEKKDSPIVFSTWGLIW